MASTSAESDATAPAFAAQFFDGASAGAHKAQARGTAEGLRITWDERELVWPWKGIRRVDGGRGQARLTYKNGDARLILDEDSWSALARTKRGDQRTTLRRETLIGGGVLVVAAALFAVFHFGLPAAAAAVGAMMPTSMEARLGVTARKQIAAVMPPCKGARAKQADVILTGLAQKLAKGSGSRFPIKVEIVDAGFPNAFALPGGAILITSDLVADAEHPDEVAGVLAHEVAHVAERHVAKGFVRSMTIGALADLLIGGGTGAAAPIASMAISASALRYDRADETEADRKGAEYLQRAGLDPGAIARFFERVIKIEKSAKTIGFEVPELLSTHPDSARRAVAARKLARPGSPPALSAYEWTLVKSACPVRPRSKTSESD